MRAVFVFGNPLVEEDSLPLRLLPRLRETFPSVRFTELDPAEDLRILGRAPVILDAVKGISGVSVINDIGAIEGSPRCSLHDLDLGANLKLMKKTGLLNEVTIIAVPPSMPPGKALEGVKEALERILPGSERANKKLPSKSMG